MLRRSLFVSAFMLAGVVGFASSAKAQVTGTVNLSGTVPTACTFGTATDGVLAANDDNTMLETVNNGDATIVVNCASGTLQVTNIVTTSTGTAPTAEADLNILSTLTSAGNPTTINKNAGTLGTPTAGVAAPAVGETASVKLEAAHKTPTTALGAGTYDFAVTVTATKN